MKISPPVDPVTKLNSCSFSVRQSDACSVDLLGVGDHTTKSSTGYICSHIYVIPMYIFPIYVGMIQYLPWGSFTLSDAVVLYWEGGD